MEIKYGTLTNYVYYIRHCDGHNQKRDSDAAAHTDTIMKSMRKLQRKIIASGALDPANPQTRDIVGEDLYDIATQNGILFYQPDINYIHNVIHTDNVYRILPKTPYFAKTNPDIDYMIEKMIVNYEYFLDETTPPVSTKRALICIIGSLIDFMTATNPKFKYQLANDRPFIQRWFEKIR